MASAMNHTQSCSPHVRPVFPPSYWCDSLPCPAKISVVPLVLMLDCVQGELETTGHTRLLRDTCFPPNRSPKLLRTSPLRGSQPLICADLSAADSSPRAVRHPPLLPLSARPKPHDSIHLGAPVTAVNLIVSSHTLPVPSSLLGTIPEETSQVLQSPARRASWHVAGPSHKHPVPAVHGCVLFRRAARQVHGASTPGL